MNQSTKSFEINKDTFKIGTITPDGALSFMTINPQKLYNWKPQSDITAYELALLMPLLLTNTSEYIAWVTIDNLPEDAKRHLEEVE